MPTTGYAPLTVDFNGRTSFDNDGWITFYEWKFGDGTPDSLRGTISHTYATPGTYSAQLMVIDNLGVRGFATVQITVADPAGTGLQTLDSPGDLGAKTGSTTVGPSSNTVPCVALVWTDNSDDESGFSIERCTKIKNGYTAYTQVGTVAPDMTSYTDVVGSGTYSYRVRAYDLDTGIVSEYSNVVSVRVK